MAMHPVLLHYPKTYVTCRPSPPQVKGNKTPDLTGGGHLQYSTLNQCTRSGYISDFTTEGNEGHTESQNSISDDTEDFKRT